MIRPAPVDPPELNHTLWSNFTPGTFALDVGANCGQTIPAIQRLFPEVVAFEPAVEAYEYLEAHFGARPGLTLSPMAVSDHTGMIELMAAPSKIETGQLVTHGTAGMEWSEDEMANGVQRSLPSITIDDYCMQVGRWPDFIKIDVEGHEGHVLAGAAEALSRKPQMLIEVHSEFLGTLIASMLDKTHRLVTVRHPHYAPGSVLWRTHFWYLCFPTPELGVS